MPEGRSWNRQALLLCNLGLPIVQLVEWLNGKLSFWQIKKLKKQFKLVLWDVLSGDYKKNITSLKVQENILKHTEPGSIIVMHNNKNSLAKIKPILKSTIRKLKRKKFKFQSTW